VAVFAPAKLNLFLAVTGRRPDGFHDLVSLVTPVDFGDVLRLAVRPAATADTLECAAAGVPADATNLVLRAAVAWRSAGGEAPYVHASLEKRTPAGAGLGGGSSDAVAALRGLQELATKPLPADRLAAVAAALGSDCPLFLAAAPVVLRGRGERVSALEPTARARLAGRRVLVAKPSFGIETPWAYGRLAAGAPEAYLAAATAEHRLADWIAGRCDLADLVFNSFEPVAFGKFAALPTLAARLRERCGLQLHLTGSGSACLALLPPKGPRGDPVREVREAWGPDGFVAIVQLP